jgi:hypothetical protein
MLAEYKIYDKVEPNNASWTRSLPLPVLYSSTYEQVQFKT